MQSNAALRDEYLAYKYNQFQEAFAVARAAVADIPRNSSVDDFFKLYDRATYRLHRLALSASTTETVTATGEAMKQRIADQMETVEAYGLLPDVAGTALN